MAQIVNCQYVRNVINANGGNMGACANPTQIANMEYVGAAFNNNFGEGAVPSQYMTKQIADTAAVKGCLASLRSILLASDSKVTWLSRNGKEAGDNANMYPKVDGIYKDTVNGRAVALYLDDIYTGRQYQFRVTTDAGLSWQDSAWLSGGTGKYAVLAKGMGFTPSYRQRLWFANMGGVYTIGDIFNGAEPSLFWETPSSWQPPSVSKVSYVAGNDKDSAAYFTDKYYFIVSSSSFWGVLDNPFQDLLSLSVGDYYGTTRVMAVGREYNGSGSGLIQVFNMDGTIHLSMTTTQSVLWGGFCGQIPLVAMGDITEFSVYRISSQGILYAVASTISNSGGWNAKNSVPYSSGLLTAIANKVIYIRPTDNTIQWWDSSVAHPQWMCLMK